MQASKRLLFLLLALFFSTALVSNAQDNELISISFADQDTKYSYEEENEKLIINAEGQNSASGLFVSNPAACLEANQLTWSWRVDQIHDTADITVEEKEDFAASILIIFGKPGLLSKPKGLSYAFTSSELPKNTVVKSPNSPDGFRTIVLENQESSLMEWFQHKRNILEDYQLAYGEMPKKKLFSIGVFTDNDQTEESVKASYELQSCHLTAQDFSGARYPD